MKTFVLICAVVLSLSVTSCLQRKSGTSTPDNPYKDFQEHTVKGVYSIKAPSYMSLATKLNDEASLQLKNMFKGAYLIVIDEPKQEFIDVFNNLDEYDSNASPLGNYRSVQVSSMKENAGLVNVSNPDKQRINGLDAEVITADGFVEEAGERTDIKYVFGFIESPDDLYMVMAWTSKSKIDKLKEDYIKTIRSFSLLTKTTSDSVVSKPVQ